MAKNTMGDLRNHLFETIERLKSNSDPDASPNEKIDIATAKQISESARVIIDSVKVEVDYLKVISKADNRESVIGAASNMLPKVERKAIGQ